MPLSMAVFPCGTPPASTSSPAQSFHRRSGHEEPRVWYQFSPRTLAGTGSIEDDRTRCNGSDQGLGLLAVPKGGRQGHSRPIAAQCGATIPPANAVTDRTRESLPDPFELLGSVVACFRTPMRLDRQLACQGSIRGSHPDASLRSRCPRTRGVPSLGCRHEADHQLRLPPRMGVGRAQQGPALRKQETAHDIMFLVRRD